MPQHPKYGYIPFPVGTVRGPYRHESPSLLHYSFMVRIVGGSWAPYKGTELRIVQLYAHGRGRAEVQKSIEICREEGAVSANSEKLS